MLWLNAHRADLDETFAEGERIINMFPDGLNRLGLAYFAKFDMRREDSTKNYICYLLPYWMKEIVAVPDSAARKLCLANVFVMLYYFVVDDVMDSATGEHRDKLPLANLFQLQFQSIYRELYPPHSPFWHHYESYVREWADAVAGESTRDPFYTDRKQVAWKASPVKNASTGALLLAGREDLVPVVTEAVDQVLICLQMLDDWVDWEEDLAEGTYNCLLAFLRRSADRPGEEPMTAEWVKQQVFVQDRLEGFKEIAASHQENVRRLGLPLHELAQFQSGLVNDLQAAADEIKEKRLKLLSGGFYYFMSETSNF
ncbi:hypothetical protein ACFPES_03455 [Paenibacillus sp. GCM10023248]|uniref:hypothetical protein n=1 Tax=unclassified Paenibacillus TaxID=185978 RepID=UPI0023799E52|nr:hypothetical protein [Paenibacillus sp. MAHUQ-63]MDD9266082.1 hypothetical protein [Paenibacillus sp. MAHUQ-63]